ncbi:hypothetical protein J6590_087381 [Homalodisca vitripennis]|nr:hypothetical protein J6590_087381 [Homalodisca vitripennis]
MQKPSQKIHETGLCHFKIQPLSYCDDGYPPPIVRATRGGMECGERVDSSVSVECGARCGCRRQREPHQGSYQLKCLFLPQHPSSLRSSPAVLRWTSAHQPSESNFHPPVAVYVTNLVEAPGSLDPRKDRGHGW